MTAELDRHPEYYDVAFTWDLTKEIEFSGRVFTRHVPFPVKRILEPASGTGRFRDTGASLRRGGVSIVHLSCAWDGEPDRGRNVREAERDGVRVRTTWRIERDDPEARLSHQVCSMEIDDRSARNPVWQGLSRQGMMTGRRSRPEPCAVATRSRIRLVPATLRTAPRRRQHS